MSWKVSAQYDCAVPKRSGFDGETLSASVVGCYYARGIPACWGSKEGKKKNRGMKNPRTNCMPSSYCRADLILNRIDVERKKSRRKPSSNGSWANDRRMSQPPWAGRKRERAINMPPFLTESCRGGKSAVGLVTMLLLCPRQRVDLVGYIMLWPSAKAHLTSNINRRLAGSSCILLIYIVYTKVARYVFGR